MRPATVNIISRAAHTATWHVHADLPSGPLRVWTGTYPLVDLDGTVWQPVGKWGQITEIRQESATVSSGFTVGLLVPFDSPDNVAAFSAKLKADFEEDTRGRRLDLYLIAWNNGLQQVNPPQHIAGGRMSPPRVTMSRGSAAIEVDVSGLLSYGAHPVNRFVTDADQQARYPGDTFLQFVSELHSRTIRWPVS